MSHDRVCPIRRKGLGDSGFVLELRGKITEGFKTIGQRRVAFADGLQRISRRRETAVGVAAHHNRIAFAGDDFIAVDHVDDRRTGLAFPDPGLTLRVAGLVIDNRLACGCPAAGSQAHLFFGHCIAIVATALGHHHHFAEQTVGNVACIPFSAECGTTAAGGECAFALGIEGIGTGRTGGYQSIGVAPGVRRNIVDAVDRLQTVDLKPDMAVTDLLIDLEVVVIDLDFAFYLALLPVFLATGVGLVGQQVLQVDGQAVTGSHPQHQRPRALVRPKRDLARHRRTPCGQWLVVVIHHITAQGEHHAVDVLRPQAVEHQRLVQGDDVRHQIAFATCCSLGRFNTDQWRDH